MTVVLSFFHPRTRLTRSALKNVFTRTAKGGVPLVAAASSVGIILGVVTLTGIGTKFPSTILLLAGENLLLALILIMVGSIVLYGMLVSVASRWSRAEFAADSGQRLWAWPFSLWQRS